MANLQIKGVDDALYSQLKKLAAAKDRSVSQQVLHLIRTYLATEKRATLLKTPARTLLELAGSWSDPRSPEEITRDIRSTRKNSRRLSKGL